MQNNVGAPVSYQYRTVPGPLTFRVTHTRAKTKNAAQSRNHPTWSNMVKQLMRRNGFSLLQLSGADPIVDPTLTEIGLGHGLGNVEPNN